MKNLLLTSTGLRNKRFSKLFLDRIGKPAEAIKVIYVPSAATSDDAREMLPHCYADLTGIGILPENIFIYHLGYLTSHTSEKAPQVDDPAVPPVFRLLSAGKLKQYDAIYFCGGDPVHLLNEINRTGFAENLKQAVENGLFYLGTSAGALIAANNFPDNLGYLNNCLQVHCEHGTPSGVLPEKGIIQLSNSQAVYLEGSLGSVIE